MNFRTRTRSAQKHRSVKAARGKRFDGTRSLALEPLEQRTLLTAGLFLQGTAFVDVNGNGLLDYDGPSPPYGPGPDLYKDGASHNGALIGKATIQLYQQSPTDQSWTKVGETLTDSNGAYLFDDSHNMLNGNLLQPGTYRLVEIAPAGFQSQNVQISSQLNSLASSAQPDGNNAILVTLVDPSNLTVTYQTRGANLPVNFQVGGWIKGSYVGQFLMQAALPGHATIPFNSFCAYLGNVLSPGDSQEVLPSPSSTITQPGGGISQNGTDFRAYIPPPAGLPMNAGRIAYLYSHYGTDLLSDNQTAAALQTAIWELEYDTVPDLSSGTFKVNYVYNLVNGVPSGQAPQAVTNAFLALANDFVDDSAGKSETVAFLDPTVFYPLNVARDFQTVLATASYNFANVPVSGPSHRPAIGIVKLTNGTDNDTGTGPLVAVGSTVTWTYNVTNTGDVTLGNVVVTDDNGTPADPADDFTVGTIASLAPGATGTLTHTGIATAGQYGNVGTATGTPVDSNGNPIPDVPSPTASNPDHYFGAAPGIAIVKLTNGTDNNAPTGPVVPVGSSVTWTYNVTNTGNVPLSGVTVVDDNGTPGNPADDFTVAGGVSLAVAETQSFTASGAAAAGQYENYATATGSDSIGQSVSARDVDHYFGVQPAGIDIEKYVKLVETCGGGGRTPGFWKQPQHYDSWSGGWTRDCGYGSAFGVDAPGGASLLEALSTGGGGVYALMRQSTAALLNAASGGMNYQYSTWQVISMVRDAFRTGDYEGTKNLFEAANEHEEDRCGTGWSGTCCGYGLDADEAPGLKVEVGDTIRFTYTVKNTTQVPLENVVVTDDNGTPSDTSDDFNPTPVLDASGYNVGDTNHDNVLDAGETWLYTDTTTVVEGQHSNLATVTANPQGGTTVTDSDPAYWLGVSPVCQLGSLSGFVYVDENNNGEVDQLEAGIEGVTITLTNFWGRVVDQTQTDANGFYIFENLLPGIYTLKETQPANYVDGQDTVGSLGGVNACNDVISQIAVARCQDGVGYNFGEQVSAGTAVYHGQTATIGFWQNKNGQALIKSLNGGENAKNLGYWLADNFGKLYGSLRGLTNKQIATAYQTAFKKCGMKLDAQVFAVALAMYVTDYDLAGYAGVKYGFSVTSQGLAASSYNVGISGLAFGDNFTTMTVMEIMTATNNQVNRCGMLFGGNALKQFLANLVFTGINEAGDIQG